MQDNLSLIPQFGLYHLTLTDAGMLIAKCQWFRGEIDTKLKARGATNFHDGDLEAALIQQATKFTSILTKAVQGESLHAVSIKHNIQECVQPEATYVEAFTLASWLEQRDILLGDVFEDEYLTSEADLAQRVTHLIAAERCFQQIELSDDQLGEGAEIVFLRHQQAKLESENAELKAPLQNQHPITEKQKSAYLNIIGALLGLLLGSAPSGQPYSKFQNQQAVIDGMHANFGEAPGLSLRNLQDKFAQAKRQLIASKI